LLAITLVADKFLVLTLVEFVVDAFIVVALTTGAEIDPENDAPDVRTTEESTATVVLAFAVDTVTPEPPAKIFAPGNAAVGADVNIGTLERPTPASDIAFVLNEATATAAEELNPIVAVAELNVIGPEVFNTFSLDKSPED
jgi:hypothetical protein